MQQANLKQKVFLKQNDLKLFFVCSDIYGLLQTALQKQNN
jgi:hypothetical protein